MTPAQHRCYVAIRTFTETHGFSPSTRRLQEVLGYRSPATVQVHVDALRAEGHLIRNGSGRTLELAGDISDTRLDVMNAIELKSLVRRCESRLRHWSDAA